MTSTPKSPAPFADSPAPEHVRVDPESAISEWMKSKLPPGSPRLVFSTRALDHGTSAARAATLRPGFAWNEPMDLLWALGFPEAVILVDGLPFDETPESSRAFWDPNDAMRKRNRTFRGVTMHHRVLSRRAAFAILSELEYGEHPFDDELDDYLKYTSHRELSEDEVREFMDAAFEYTDDDFERFVFVLEALVGPSLIARELIRALSNDRVQAHALMALRTLQRRLPASERDALLAEVANASLHGDNEGIREELLHPDKKPAETLRIVELARRDRASELTDAAVERDKAKRCSPRAAFTGSEKVLTLMAERFKTYDKLDVTSDHLHVLSAIRTTALLPAQIQLLNDEEVRAQFQAWLAAHAADLTPGLKALEADAKWKKLAAPALAITSSSASSSAAASDRRS